MTSVILVDWLGRGGIAQTTESWGRELATGGAQVLIVTRPGRELADTLTPTVTPAHDRGRVRAHAALCRLAARQIESSAPDLVVIQNFVIPVLEEEVHRAARRVGAKVVFVIHDHRHHEWREGTHVGLRSQLRKADEVVAHTVYVANRLPAEDVTIIPLPMQFGLLEAAGESVVEGLPGTLLALQVGVLNRRYKGTPMATSLAAGGVPGWSFAFTGVGAPSSEGSKTVRRFLEPGELRATVEAADAVLLPYRNATQSGAVLLAQACSTVPVASAVGGIPEQIDDGVDGLLVPLNATVADWRVRLEALRDDAHRAALEHHARHRAHRNHQAFVSAIQDIAGMAGGTSSR